jgi:hypothetical protein
VVALIAYIPLLALQVLVVKLRWRRPPTSLGSVIARVPSWIVADFTNPFRGLRALTGMVGVIDPRGARGAFVWGTQILHLVWSLVLWVWLAIGLAVVAS